MGLGDREVWVPRRMYFERGNGKAHRMNFWEGLSPKEGWTACIPRPGRYATGSNAGLLSGYIGELV